ncbi:RadC family protein [Lacticaseibacillus porcinae]|uniref:RadC family protein n=1 Tax=Lacticaseibacillus porcinae TaxID=1123687 RepID=UPI000F76621C|nr:DNA repair protein RadC [Lacticaseibacillus porcinae]
MKPDLYERIVKNGASALSDAELYRVLLRNGSKGTTMAQTVAELQGRFPDFRGLNAVDAELLMTFAGIGLSKAAGLLAAIEFGRRVMEQSTKRYGEVLSVESLAEELMPRLGASPQEHVLAFLLDTQLKLIQEMPVAVGGLTQADAEPRVVFSQALKVHAASLILVHNHPSGHVLPSQADIDVTARFVQVGELIGVSVLDHVIIGAHDYYSFASHHQGLNFFK